MTRLAICTAVYETGRPFLADWVDGARAAGAGKDVQAVVAVDDLADPEAALAPLVEAMPVTFAKAPTGASPATVRATMLAAAVASNAEILVFCDMDDRLLEGALALHEAALADADFSYGDMELADEEGTRLGRTFFEGCAVPTRLAGEDGRRALLERNFLGFTNTAVRRDALDPDCRRIPAELATADWWLFTTLLRRGRCGARTAAPVACYRTHRHNLLGARPGADRAAVAQRIDLARRHHAMFPDDPVAAAQEQALTGLAAELARRGADMQSEIEAACAAPGVWFEDISRLARRCASAATA